MTDPNAFAKLVPGFDFLQGLMKGAGGAVPAMQQWIAPTLDPDELDKRIRDLRTVQFWLEQNARLIATSIQALEVQRMTLSTLKTMNLPLAGLQEAMTLTPPASPSPTPAPAPAAAAESPAPARPKPRPSARASKPATASPAIDPMQWWGALTQQFGELASRALTDLPGVPGAKTSASADTPEPTTPAAKPSASTRKRASSKKRARKA